MTAALRPALHALLTLALALILGAPAVAQGSFVTFETGQVRPLAMSPDGSRLFVLNTPDNRLEIFSLASGSPVHTGALPVGLEPIAVAARSDGEVWVVNHLSDSVSVVDVSGAEPRIVRTLLVGDEPRDIVFAGPGGNRAFITAAHRGQNNPNDPQLRTPGVGRADVWVFDAANLGAPLGGTPLTIVTLFGDTPRALATDASGQTVYAAVFHSGNRTTTVTEQAVCDGFAGPCNVSGVPMPGGLPGPDTNFDGVPAPETGLVVKYNAAVDQWQDQLGRNWNNAVKFDLPDLDVFAIDAMASPPVEIESWPSVGTILFSLAVNPVSGKVYASNTEARNEVRFEGPGIFGGSTVRGNLHQARITVIDPAQPTPPLAVTPRHLNKHIDYGVVPSPPGTAANSLATPLEMALTADGATLYVAAFGSSKVGVFSTAALENDTFVPSAASHIEVSGGGPTGLVLDEVRGRLYAFTRFDNSLAVIDTSSASEVAHLPLYNPEPAHVRNGRPVLYDARTTSSNGEASCAACHIFGDFDSLAWDLGNPDDEVLPNLNPFRVADPLGISFPDHHPMKGPMTTQSLRGMANHGPMHWRGDRSGANDVPPSGAFNEKAAFIRFNGAFEGLVGRSGPISDVDMAAFADFILEVRYPPNPIRSLDNGLTPDQQAGRTFYFGPQPSDVFETCNGCHVLDPAQGFFGGDGRSSFEFETQLLKIPHLRNMYQKIGMFGMPAVPFFNAGDNGDKGDQVRGFGFLHDGSVDTLFRFHRTTVFNQNNPAGFPIPNPGGFANGAAGDPLRRQVEDFMFVFDSDLAPIVGQQATMGPASDGMVLARVSLLSQRAAAGECDLVVKGNVGPVARGWYRLADGTFQSDREEEPPYTALDLENIAFTAGSLTFTCVPPGSGVRIGVDRDEDGFFDRDEIDAGTDPADAESFPGSIGVTNVRSTSFVLDDDAAPPVDERRRRMRFRSSRRGSTPSGVVLPESGGLGDPTLHGATLLVYRADGQGEAVTIDLPKGNWRATGGTPAKRFKYNDGRGESGPIRSVQLTAKALAIRGVGLGLFSLENAPNVEMALRLQLGSAGQLCAAAPAKEMGNPPSTAKTDTTSRFVGSPNTAAPGVCPPLPVVGSASRAFLVETRSLVEF